MPSAPPLGRRLARLVAAVVLVLAALPATAFAHATLVGTSPVVGRPLADAPRALTLRFSERIEQGLGQVRVYDARGREVQRGAPYTPQGRPDELAVALREGLPRGHYTTTYLAIAADAHSVKGTFTFDVGAPVPGAVAAPIAVADADRAISSSAFSLLRGVQYAAIAGALGALVFLLVCWPPAGAPPAAASALAARARQVLAACALAGLVSAVLGLLAQGALGEGTSWWAAARWDTVSAVLGTRFGMVWGAAAVAWAVLLAGLAAWPKAGRHTQPAGARARPLMPGRFTLLALSVPAFALAVLPALAGHTGTASPAGVLLPANVVHVLAISAWLGGIVMLVVGLPHARRAVTSPERDQLTVAVLGRFSTLAGLAVAALLLTGVVQAAIELGPPRHLLDTAFGRAVLIKALLAVALVALGAVNRRRLLPALRARGADAAGAARGLLNRTLRAELLLGAAALTTTGVLAGAVPGRSVPPGTWSQTASLGTARVGTTIEPARPGANTITFDLDDARTGAALTDLEDLEVTAALPGAGIAPVALPLQQMAFIPGRFQAYDATLVPAGTWIVTVTARRGGAGRYRARFAVPVR